MNGFSYDDPAFHLGDSQSYRAFCLIGFADKPPKKSTLQRNLKQVRAETLERVNRALVAHAQQHEIEDGRRLRSDADESCRSVKEGDGIRTGGRLYHRGPDVCRQVNDVPLDVNLGSRPVDLIPCSRSSSW
jgi:hypothetical protein